MFLGNQTSPASEASCAVRRRVLLFVGTRPEAIKLAPVMARLRATPGILVRVCATAQHREMLDSALETFGLRPDLDLDVMERGQTLNTLLAHLGCSVDAVLRQESPDLVIVQGDTTTAMVCALAAFHLGIRVAHVEAGLRTGSIRSPFPEELNRRIISLIADLHFATTHWAADQLKREGVSPASIVVTGSTAVDSLHLVAKLPPRPFPEPLDRIRLHRGPLVLVTAHRRESLGQHLRSICMAVRRIVAAVPDVLVAFPVHPNPEVSSTVHSVLDGEAGVLLSEPMDYVTFVNVMRRAALILTDSGGVQEEAPTIGCPVLLLRQVTERPEAVASGHARLVGIDEDQIVETAVSALASDCQRCTVPSPYGDGRASERIAAAILGRLQ